MKIRTFAGVATLALAASALGTTVVHIDDQEMPASNWSAIVINQFGGFSGSAGQAGAGGNPGAYRSISHSSAVSPAAGWMEHSHIQTWTPSVQGQIVSLDMGMDVNCFNGGTSGAVLFGLIVVQGDQTYYGPTFTPLSNSGWKTDLQFVGLTNEDFSGAPISHPDFSMTGDTLTFGFYSSNGSNSGVPISSSSGADSFKVVLNVISSCVADIAPPPDGDDTVGVPDLLAVINAWGPCVKPPAECPADITGDETIGVPDLLAVINAWGSCL